MSLNNEGGAGADYGTSIPHKPLKNHPQRQQHRQPKSNKDGGELVKHMSNLPAYLQRPHRLLENNNNNYLQGNKNAFSFGVLDWERLEKWKYSSSSRRKQIIPATAGISGSELSHQTEPYSSLRSHLTSSAANSIEIPSSSSQGGRKQSRGNASILEDFVAARLSSNDLTLGKNVQILGTDRSHMKTKIIETSSSSCKGDKMPLNSEGKVKARTNHESQESESPDRQLLTGRHKKNVLLPSESTKRSCAGTSRQSESAKECVAQPAQVNHSSVSGNFVINKQEIQFTDVTSDIPWSRPVSSRAENKTELGIKSATMPGPLETPCVHFIDTHAKENSSAIHHTSLTVIESSRKRTTEAAATECTTVKGRYPSPTHLHETDLSRMGRSCSFKEFPAMPQLCSDYVTAKSGPVGSDAYPCPDNSNKEKENANTRAKSSPLRRLLDPLLKSKAVNHFNHAAETLQSASMPSQRERKSSLSQLDSSKVQPVKRNLSFSSLNPTNNIDCSHPAQEHPAPMVQGNLEVTIKDGFPMFTFGLSNNSENLVATMKKIGSFGKYDCSWTYTFYSLHKRKKKSGGWISQGSRCKSHECNNPIVIGLMKVSGSRSPKLNRRNSKGRHMVREFVLFGAEQTQEGQDIPDFQPCNELAAIVVKVPKVATGRLSSDKYKDFSEVIPPGISQENRCSSNSSTEYVPSEPRMRNRNLFSTTVILPTGLHGLPAFGVPSPLIDRWRSGGSCDCGGWDVGCKLTVLASQDKHISALSCSSKDFSATDKFELFIQGEATQDNGLVFSMNSLRNGIYSVGFSPPISSLQAFSICTAILHGRKLVHLSEVSNLLEDKTPQDIKTADVDRIKLHTQVLEGEVLPTYVPFPPLSPVGRV